MSLELTSIFLLPVVDTQTPYAPSSWTTPVRFRFALVVAVFYFCLPCCCFVAYLFSTLTAQVEKLSALLETARQEASEKAVALERAAAATAMKEASAKQQELSARAAEERATELQGRLRAAEATVTRLEESVRSKDAEIKVASTARTPR